MNTETPPDAQTIRQGETMTIGEGQPTVYVPMQNENIEYFAINDGIEQLPA